MKKKFTAQPSVVEVRYRGHDGRQSLREGSFAHASDPAPALRIPPRVLRFAERVQESFSPGVHLQYLQAFDANNSDSDSENIRSSAEPSDSWSLRIEILRPFPKGAYDYYTTFTP
jgi:hypothetical protein